MDPARAADYPIRAQQREVCRPGYEQLQIE